MGRYFVAVRPPDSVMGELEALRRPEVDGLRWTRREQWHVTLAFLGDVDATAVEAALGEVEAAAVRAELGPRVETLRQDVVVIPVRGLDGLAGAVRSGLEPTVPGLSGRRFRGHLTLARSRKGVPGDVLGQRFSASFEVEEFSLVSSDRDPSGARHTYVADYRVDAKEGP